MASVYFRIKEGGTWRYRAIGRGRPPKGAKFHVRYTDARKKQTWSQPYDTVDEAQEAAANIGTILQARLVAGPYPRLRTPKMSTGRPLRRLWTNSSTLTVVSGQRASRPTPLA